MAQTDERIKWIKIVYLIRVKYKFYQLYVILNEVLNEVITLTYIWIYKRKIHAKYPRHLAVKEGQKISEGKNS